MADWAAMTSAMGGVAGAWVGHMHARKAAQCKLDRQAWQPRSAGMGRRSGRSSKPSGSWFPSHLAHEVQAFWLMGFKPSG